MFLAVFRCCEERLCPESLSFISEKACIFFTKQEIMSVLVSYWGITKLP